MECFPVVPHLEFVFIADICGFEMRLKMFETNNKRLSEMSGGEMSRQVFFS